MRILLVAPAIDKYLLLPNEKSKEVKQFRFSLLSLLSVAACTPTEHSIQIVDEHVEQLNFELDVDVVGVSLMTGHATRAYEIGDNFLRRNRIVIFGGFHPSFLPEEALPHCSAIVVGEAETAWPQVLKDIKQMTLKKIYRNAEPIDLAMLNTPPRYLLEKRRREYITINAVQISRGCENKCNFCSIPAFYGSYRMRPIAKVVEELRTIRSQHILFIDDNIVGNAQYAREMFKAITPLKKKWVSQSSLKMVQEPGLLKAAVLSGCKGLFIGFETTNEQNLALVGKDFNKAEEYVHAVRVLHKHGVNVQAALIFGFDNDDSSVFERTLSFIESVGIDAIQTSILTPLPGTKLFEQMESQNRIVDRNWRNYDYRHVVFKPAKMSSAELLNGTEWIIGEFYRKRRIARRILKGLIRGDIFGTLHLSLPVNIGYHIDSVRWRINGIVPSKLAIDNKECNLTSA
jgi:radical SAM superfamily enzyme YgiQ (UPF0313 family)